MDNVAGSRWREYDLTATAPINPAIRWAFYAFVFSILIEAAPIGIPFKLTIVTGGLLILMALLQPRLCFRNPPAAFWCFVAYLNVGIISLLLHNALFEEDVIPRLFVFAQLLILFWVAYNLMCYERIARGALVALVASCVTLGILQMLGLAAPTVASHNVGPRLASFGLDPNQLAGLLALGLLALIGLAFTREDVAIRTRLLALPLFALIAVTIVETGSRGGMIGLAAGLLALTLGGRSLSARLRNALIVALGVLFFVGAVLQSDVVRGRFEQTLGTGDMTAREMIYPVAWQMFLDKPLLGWGPLANTVELGDRMRMATYTRLDTHNLVLYVLTATGILGAIPFFTGVGLCVRSAWKARTGPHGILPFAMMASLLMADMSVSGLDWKQHWLILAYALASGSLILPRPAGREAR